VLLHPYAKAGGHDADFAPVDVQFSPTTLVQPDLLIVPRRTDGTRAQRFEDVGHLLLAVEAISPSSRVTDRREKRDLYMREGVPVYWIVDGESETVEVWRPGHDTPEIERERLELHLPGAAGPLHPVRSSGSGGAG
jgi:Uma2 family endonuclease